VLDAYPLWVDALEQVLARAGIDVVARASRPADALALAEHHAPDVLVGEIHGLDPTLDGAALVEAAGRRCPGLRTIVVSSSENPHAVQCALAAGASAYVFKTARTAELMLVMRRAFDGDGGVGGSGRDGDAAPGLTKRELEILRLVSEGHSNAQLARMLWVTEQTVKFHLSNIYRKLDVANRTEASRWAQMHDLLPVRPNDSALPVH
jgi:DNA-binding NarL/FixJ family response regulator